MCCKNFGCDIFPQDVKRIFNTDTITLEIIMAMLRHGYVQLDWWEGDIRDNGPFDFSDRYLDNIDILDMCYYLHMRNDKNAAIQPSYGGQCRMLTPDGCALSWHMRPTGGKSLVPEPSGDFRKCNNAQMSKPECVLAWLPYQEILYEVNKIFPQQHHLLYTVNAVEDEYPVLISPEEIKTDSDALKAFGVC